MPSQAFQQLSSAQTPHIHTERIQRPSTHQILSAIHRQTRELCRFRSLQHSEITILNQIISTHSAVLGSSEQRIALLGQELDVCDGRGVLGEGHEAEAVAHGPELQLAVFASGGEQGAVGGVCYG